MDNRKQADNNKQMDTNWLNHPSLNKMHPAKKQIVLDFIKESQGQPMNVAMNSMASANAKMKALNLSFTKEESTLMTNIMISSMPPEKRAQAEMLMKMMRK